MSIPLCVHVAITVAYLPVTCRPISLSPLQLVSVSTKLECSWWWFAWKVQRLRRGCI